MKPWGVAVGQGGWRLVKVDDRFASVANEPTPSDLIAHRVRMMRTAMGLTVAELAARCAEQGMPKLTAQTLYKLEGARNVPDRPPRPVTVDELLVLARALGVSPADLCPELGGIADPLPDNILDNAEGMPIEAVRAYLLGALRMMNRWQADFEADKERSKDSIFRDPKTSPFAFGRRQNDDGTWELT